MALIGDITYDGEPRRIAVLGADPDRGLIHVLDVRGVGLRAMLRLRLGLFLGRDWRWIRRDPAWTGRYRTLHADRIGRA
jgi:hypothetical protein